jgi:hypothetical protein
VGDDERVQFLLRCSLVQSVLLEKQCPKWLPDVFEFLEKKCEKS